MLYILLSYLFSPFIYLFIALNQNKPVNRILIIQTAKIGDLICSTPVFREVKRKYPNSRLTVIIDPGTKELLEHNPHVNEIIILKKTDYTGFTGRIKLINLIHNGKYDISICLNPNVPYAISMFWGLIPVRLSVMPDFSGITFKLASVFFTGLEKHVRGKQTIETYMKMLERIRIKSKDISKEVYRSEGSDEKVQQILGSTGKPLIGIGVSSGNKMKELGEGKIVGLVDLLTESMDSYIVLIGSGQDVSASGSISDAVAKKEHIINATGKLSLAELPALIERLSLFIGVDSGITYMADSLSIPLINIAGPADMQDQRPVGNDAIILQKELECVPCSHAFKAPYECQRGDRECIKSVSIEEIYSVAVKMISRT
jgi:ADP-heptose:LPS heptosyltransferase